MGQQRIKHAHKTKELKGTKSFIDKSSEDLWLAAEKASHKLQSISWGGYFFQSIFKTISQQRKKRL